MRRDKAREVPEFDAAFDAAVADCTELTRGEAAHFVEHGYVVVKGAFPPPTCGVGMRECLD